MINDAKKENNNFFNFIKKQTFSSPDILRLVFYFFLKKEFFPDY